MNTTIAGELLGLDAREQGMVDMLMLEADGTEQIKLRCERDPVSLARPSRSDAVRHAVVALRWRCSVHRALVPMFNILNGGKHADNTVDFQVHGATMGL